ncbi:MAG: NAD(P)-dependent oxidoreductase [Azospirillum sp.]|nr:NAD(P)-dependent oxidoreductase [Azospirillum sp.]
MKILMTGGSGFLGRSLVPRLLAAGHQIWALARSPKAAATLPAGVNVVMGDMASLPLSDFPAGMDAVVSLAQSEHFRNFPDRALDVFDVNVRGQLVLLDWAQRQGVKRFVMASSGGIYGPKARPFVAEDELLAVDSPLGFYLGTKLATELVFQTYRKQFAAGVILRPFFIYGPGQSADMLVSRLIASVRAGRPIQLQGPDGLKLNPVFVSDAAAAFVSALALEGFHVLNVAGPEVVTLRSFCERIGRLVGAPPRFESAQGSPSDYVASTDAAERVLGKTLVGIDAGLARTLKGESS